MCSVGWPISIRRAAGCGSRGSSTQARWSSGRSCPTSPDKDVELSVANGVLQIRAQREEKTEKKDKDATDRSSGTGRSSAAPLPEGVKEDDVTASYKDGILEIRAPSRGGGEATGDEGPHLTVSDPGNGAPGRRRARRLAPWGRPRPLHGAASR